MRLSVLLRSAKLTAIGNNQNISFLPAIASYGTYLPQGIYGARLLFFVSARTNKRHHVNMCVLLHCTASFCVFFFYRPTGRPRRISLPLECHRSRGWQPIGPVPFQARGILPSTCPPLSPSPTRTARFHQEPRSECREQGGVDEWGRGVRHRTPHVAQERRR